MNEVAAADPFFKVIYTGELIQGNFSIHHFFKDYVDPDALYIRFDDDICWMAPDAVRELIKYRVENPDFFLVFANIINNGVCTHLHQRLGCIPNYIGLCSYNAICPLSWGSPLMAQQVHELFLRSIADKQLDKYKFNSWVMWECPRFSINCFAWLGKEFAKFEGKVAQDEENWLSMYKPAAINKANSICGKALVSHFAFHTQRHYLETHTNLLDIYKGLADDCKS